MAQKMGMYTKHTMSIGWPNARQNASFTIEKKIDDARTLFWNSTRTCTHH